MNAITITEPIALPDPLRPTRMPSLPAWLALRKNATAINLQIDQNTRRFQDALTLPADLMLTAEQRAEIEAHIRGLQSLLGQTPANSDAADKATFAAVTKLLLVKPAAKTSEAAAEARGDAYMAALDDVPYWAVEAAIRLWYRGECGKDERGKVYDYTWAPEPHALRSIARREAYAVAQRVAELTGMLAIVERVDCSLELARGQAAMRGLKLCMGDDKRITWLTFAEAVRLGSESAAA